MDSIKVRQRVGEDGILHLAVPVGFADREVDVTISYQPVQISTHPVSALEKLYGICGDDPISLDGEGIMEALDDDLIGAFD